MVARKMVHPQSGPDGGLILVFRAIFHVTYPISVRGLNQHKIPTRAQRAPDSKPSVCPAICDQSKGDGLRRFLDERNPVGIINYRL